MATSLAHRSQLMQSHSVSGCLPDGKPKAAKVSLTLPDEQTSANGDVRSATLALIDEARIRAGLKQDAMAAVARVSPPTFSQGLNERNNKSFNAAWLDDQPIEFWAALHKLIGMKFNLTTESQIELLVADAKQTLEGLARILDRTVVSK